VTIRSASPAREMRSARIPIRAEELHDSEPGRGAPRFRTGLRSSTIPNRAEELHDSEPGRGAPRRRLRSRPRSSTTQTRTATGSDQRVRVVTTEILRSRAAQNFGERRRGDAGPERRRGDAGPERRRGDAGPERRRGDAGPERRRGDAHLGRGAPRFRTGPRSSTTRGPETSVEVVNVGVYIRAEA
jgi:hypothetical protein